MHSRLIRLLSMLNFGLHLWCPVLLKGICVHRDSDWDGCVLLMLSGMQWQLSESQREWPSHSPEALSEIIPFFLLFFLLLQFITRVSNFGWAAGVLGKRMSSKWMNLFINKNCLTLSFLHPVLWAFLSLCYCELSQTSGIWRMCVRGRSLTP